MYSRATLVASGSFTAVIGQYPEISGFGGWTADQYSSSGPAVTRYTNDIVVARLVMRGMARRNPRQKVEPAYHPAS